MKHYVHPTSAIDEAVQIGFGTKIWHFCHVSANAKIGHDCTIGQNVFIGEGVSIGNGVKIQNNVSVYAGVSVDDEVFIGPSAVFTNVINPRASIERKSEYATTFIGKGATIGANSSIICGNNIGCFSFIGAGAVLTCDAKDFGLYTGNPARLSGWYSMYGERLPFSIEEENCYYDEKNSVHYKLKNGIVKCRS